MKGIFLKDVSLFFAQWKISSFNLDIPAGSFLSIVGPSGSGKTTVLRIISGLQKIYSGNIYFDKNDVTNVDAENRNVGFVFQGESLFSHLDVFENIAFGPRMKKASNVEQKVKKSLGLVHLDGFENRNVNTLSGGEKKRVAIARAIAFDSDIILLDEPFNGLDGVLKEKMKILLTELREKTSLTIIMVTHDIDDAFSLSDRIAVVENGSIEQIGSPVEIFLKPKTDFVRDFISPYILIEGKKGKGSVEVSIPFPFAKNAGAKKVFVSVKKNNFRFF